MHAPDPVTESNAVERLYTEKAAFYHHLFVDLLGYGRGLEALLTANRYLRPGMKVLDAGCGTGILTRKLHAIARRAGMEGITFHAFDLTLAMMDIFRCWLAEHRVDVDLRRADVLRIDEELPADWRDYDLIVSSAMLEYLPKTSLARALGNLARLLARDGMLVVCISRRNALMKWLIQDWWKANLYERTEIARIAAEAGLDLRFGSFPFPRNHFNMWGHVIEARRTPDAAPAGGVGVSPGR